MIGDATLYQKIGQELYNGSPDGAVKLIMMASLVISDEGDVGTFEFDYVDENGNRTWFPFGSNVNTAKMRELLTQLRASYIEQGQPAWNACEFTLDLKTGSFDMNVSYDEET